MSDEFPFQVGDFVQHVTNGPIFLVVAVIPEEGGFTGELSTDHGILRQNYKVDNWRRTSPRQGLTS